MELTVKAIAGIHVVVLAMNMDEAKCPGLMGFGVHRTDHTEDEAYWLEGMKVFPSVPNNFLPAQKCPRAIPNSGFTWSDLQPSLAHRGTYKVVALDGPPGALTERATVEVSVTTEAEVLDTVHAS